mmetsp:Transcript_31103/g.77396  ORF Transcript_31103/g.77396 Transcript_31103/m.77396 type:complete len:236 (-) Transcript_31103:958-1665(-)
MNLTVDSRPCFTACISTCPSFSDRVSRDAPTCTSRNVQRVRSRRNAGGPMCDRHTDWCSADQPGTPPSGFAPAASSRRRQPRCPPSTAAFTAVKPYLSRWSTENREARSSNSCTTEVRPRSAAKISKGLSAGITLPPASISILTTSASPYVHASCSGVWPVASVESGKAPCCSSSLTVPRRPRRAAKCRGVQPDPPVPTGSSSPTKSSRTFKQHRLRISLRISPRSSAAAAARRA